MLPISAACALERLFSPYWMNFRKTPEQSDIYGSNQKRFEQLNAMNAHKLELGSRKVQCDKSDVQCLLRKKHPTNHHCPILPNFWWCSASTCVLEARLQFPD